MEALMPRRPLRRSTFVPDIYLEITFRLELQRLWKGNLRYSRRKGQIGLDRLLILSLRGDGQSIFQSVGLVGQGLPGGALCDRLSVCLLSTRGWQGGAPLLIHRRSLVYFVLYPHL